MKKTTLFIILFALPASAQVVYLRQAIYERDGQ